MTAPTAPTPPPGGPPSLVATASVTTWGHLSWVPWFWFGGALAFTGIVIAVGTWGEVTSSIWQGVTSWLAWVVFAAGVTTVTSYARTFVANGVTRERLSTSSIVSAVVIAVLGGAVAALGYAAEDLVYGLQGWPQQLHDDGVVDGPGSIVGLGLAYFAVLPVYFASGWLVGVAWNRLPWVPFAASLVPAVAPIFLVEAVVLRSGSFEVGALEGVGRLPLVAAVPVALGVAAVGVAVARRLTRDLVVEP